MRRILLAAALSSALSGCAAIGELEQASVSVGYAQAAVQAYNTAETLSTAYLRLPLCAAGQTICRTAAGAKGVANAIWTARVAKKAVLSAMATATAAGTGTIPLATYNTLNAAIATLNQANALYGASTATSGQ